MIDLEGLPNVFSKYDLEYIFYCLSQDIDRNNYSCDSAKYMVRSKIKFMLDNYAGREPDNE